MREINPYLFICLPFLYNVISSIVITKINHKTCFSLLDLTLRCLMETLINSRKREAHDASTEKNPEDRSVLYKLQLYFSNIGISAIWNLITSLNKKYFPLFFVAIFSQTHKLYLPNSVGKPTRSSHEFLARFMTLHAQCPLRRGVGLWEMFIGGGLTIIWNHYFYY